MRYSVDSFKVAIGIAVLIIVLGLGIAIGGSITEPLSEKEIKILIDPIRHSTKSKAQI